MAAAPAPILVQPFLNLTEREKRILQLLVEGLEYKDVADEMGIHLPTLRSLLSKVARREGCHHTMRLVIRYIDEYLGIGEPWDG